MLVDPQTGLVRLTRDEFDAYRRAAARNGHAVNRVGNARELMRAAVEGLPDSLLEDLLEFAETGSSRLTRLPSPEALRARLSGDE